MDIQISEQFKEPIFFNELKKQNILSLLQIFILNLLYTKDLSVSDIQKNVLKINNHFAIINESFHSGIAVTDLLRILTDEKLTEMTNTTNFTDGTQTRYHITASGKSFIDEAKHVYDFYSAIYQYIFTTENSLSKKFEIIDTLILRGEFKEALEQIPVIESNSDTTLDDILVLQLVKIKIFTKKGNFNDALTLIENIKSQYDLESNNVRTIELIISKIRVYYFLGNLPEMLKLIKRIELNINLSIETNILKVLENELNFENLKGLYYLQQDQYDEALVHFQKSLKNAVKINSKIGLSEILHNLGTFYLRQNNFDKAKTNFEKSLSYSEEISFNQGKAQSLSGLGDFYFHKGDIDKGFQYYQRSFELRKEIGNKYELAQIYNKLGRYYNDKGYLNKALDYHKQSFNFREEIGNKYEVAISLSNIGETYRLKGELTKSLDYYEKCLQLQEELGNSEESKASVLTNIGLVSIYQGHYDRAVHCFRRVIKSASEGYFNASEAFYSLIQLELDQNNIEEANEHLFEFERFTKKNEKAEEKTKILWHQLALCLFYKHYNNKNDLLKAKDIYRRIIVDKVVEFEIIQESIINLCDILIDESLNSENHDNMMEIKSLSSRLLYTAKQQGSIKLLIESYLLQAKIALIEFDIKKAKLLLNQSQILAEESGMNQLAIKISNEYDDLLNKIDQWNELIEKNSSLSERLQLAEIGNLSKNIVRKNILKFIDDSSETPIAFLIISESGITKYSKFFITNIKIQEQLLGGFLTAINSFAKEIFSSGGIERIKIKKYTLLIMVRTGLMFCYIIEGQSYFAIQKLENFVNNIQKTNNLVVMLNTWVTIKLPNIELREMDNLVFEFLLEKKID